jgi:DNA repair exonuclease SbcCD ATPase subunit
MKIDEAELDFTNTSITVFQGKNASGKSSIMEAVAICFIERRRGSTYRDYVQLGKTQSNIKLEAEYEGENISFDITITNKKTAAPVQKSITYKKKTYVNSECSPLLNSFGLDYLQYILFSLQGENDITNLKPAERANLLKKIFQFGIEDSLEKLDTELQKAQESKLKLEYEKTAALAKDFTKKELEDVFEDEYISQIIIDKAEKEQRLNQLQSQESVVQEKRKVEETLASHKSSLASEKQRQLSLMQTTNKSQQLLTDLTAEKITKETSAKTIQDKLQDANEDYAKIEAHVASVNAEIEKQSQEKMEISHEISTQKRHIEEHEKGICGACGQETQPQKVPELQKEVDELINVSLVNITNSLASLNEEKIRLEGERVEAYKRINSLDRELAQIKAEVDYLPTRIEEIETAIAQQENDIGFSDTRIKELEQGILTAEQQLSKYENIQTADVAAQIVTLKSEIASLDNIVREQEIHVAMNERIEKDNKVLEQQEKQHQEYITTLLSDIEKLEVDAAAVDKAKKLIASDFSNYILLKSCDSLETIMNEFISNVLPSVEVRLDQTKKGVTFTYKPDKSKNSSWLSTKMASGFEKQLLAISWRVALAKAFGLKLLVLDEIDSSADIETSELMFETLISLEAYFDQLLIISHKPNIVKLLVDSDVDVTVYEVSEGAFSNIS